jgi:hypothetical protein
MKTEQFTFEWPVVTEKIMEEKWLHESENNWSEPLGHRKGSAVRKVYCYECLH